MKNAHRGLLQRVLSLFIENRLPYTNSAIYCPYRRMRRVFRRENGPITRREAHAEAGQDELKRFSMIFHV